jgi:hypothetical protein
MKVHKVKVFIEWLEWFKSNKPDRTPRDKSKDKKTK